MSGRREKRLINAYASQNERQPLRGFPRSLCTVKESENRGWEGKGEGGWRWRGMADRRERSDCCCSCRPRRRRQFSFSEEEVKGKEGKRVIVLRTLVADAWLGREKCGVACWSSGERLLALGEFG